MIILEKERKKEDDSLVFLNFFIKWFKKDWLIILICLLVVAGCIYTMVTVEDTVNKELNKCDEKWRKHTGLEQPIGYNQPELNNIIIGDDYENQNNDKDTQRTS